MTDFGELHQLGGSTEVDMYDGVIGHISLIYSHPQINIYLLGGFVGYCSPPQINSVRPSVCPIRFNSLTAIVAHERQLFIELLW